MLTLRKRDVVTVSGVLGKTRTGSDSTHAPGHARRGQRSVVGHQAATGGLVTMSQEKAAAASPKACSGIHRTGQRGEQKRRRSGQKGLGTIPPFNVNKVKSEDAINAGRMPLGLSGINKAGEFSNANYLWINYFYSYLNPTGRAGFVMASSATDSSGKDRALREKLVKSGHVDAMLYVGNNFFCTKSLPCTLWFLDKGKPQGLRDKVLFIDAQNYHTVLDTTHNEWSPWQLKNLSAIVWPYRGEAGKYAVLVDEYCAAIRDMANYVDGDAKGALVCVTTLDDFASARDALSAYVEDRKAKAKGDVETAKPRERRRLRAAYDEEIAELEDALTVIDEALWLTDKFGVGEYADVPGLCKIASLQKIEEKDWSLTPGAHVGVPSQEDDGVDFHERMCEIHEELLRLQTESNELMATISRNFEELGL